MSTNRRARLTCAALIIGLNGLSPLWSRTGADHYDKRAEAAPRSQRSASAAMQDDLKEIKSAHGRELEETFLTKMLDHHQSGIDMAKMGEAKSATPSIQKLARKIIREQGADIGTMRGYLSRWYHNPAAAKPDPRMHDTMQKLGLLSGAAFDRAFLMEFIKHHASAIQMSEIASAKAQHPQVRQFAAHIIRAQRPEQRKMRRLLNGLKGQ